MSELDGPTVPIAAPSMVPVAPDLGGRYEIVGLLGMGGMGAVYRARDRELGENVALKMIRPDLGYDPDALSHFRKEVRLARRVTHRNVARTYDLGESGGHRFLTMELVDGETLADLIDREGALSVARTAQIAAEICEALVAAHAAGVVHRDLKPGNVMLARDGRVVVMDFGVALALGEIDESQSQNAGTPAYMAPEQIQCVDDIDGRADEYALGMMMYEMLTGTPPFAGKTPLATLVARLVEPPPDPRDRMPGLPATVAAIVMRCMEIRREDRYPELSVVAAEIGPMALSQSGELEAAGTRARRRGTRGTAVAVLPIEGKDAGAGPLAQGLTEELVDGLSSIPGLRVRSHGAVGALGPAASGDVREQGRQLGVQAVAHGSLRADGGTLRVSLRLTTVDDGFQIWSRRLESSRGDLLRLADDVAADIAEALGVSRPATRNVLRDPETVDLYLRGRQEYFKFQPAANVRAVELLRLASERAPEDPVVLSAYALAVVRQFGVDAAARTHESAEAVALAAAKASPERPEPRVALAAVTLHKGDSAGAASCVAAVLREVPGSPDAHELAARLLFEAGALDEGARHLENALLLEPRWTALHYVALRARALAGDWEDAERVLLGPLDRHSPFNYWAHRLRFSFWRNDPGWIEGLDLAHLPGAADGELHVTTLSGIVLRERRKLPELDTLLERACVTKKFTPRVHSFYRQIRAEISAYLGDDDAAAAAVRASTDAGLFDSLWLEGCPVLRNIRDRADVAAARAIVRERALRVIEAFAV